MDSSPPDPGAVPGPVGGAPPPPAPYYGPYPPTGPVPPQVVHPAPGGPYGRAPGGAVPTALPPGPRVRAGRRRSVVRAALRRWRVLPRAGTVAAVLVASFSTTLTMAFIWTGRAADGPMDGWTVLVWLVGIAVAVGLVWRSRAPVLVCVLASVPALFLPLDAVGALIALPWVVARAARRRVWMCVVLVAAAVGLALWRDARRVGEAVVFSLVDVETGERSYLPAAGYVVLGVLAVAASVGVGLARRWRESARTAQGMQLAQEQVADELRHELSRQDERDLIAREVHDTVAHHLSLVALQAAALEVTSDDRQGEVSQAARSMRSSAHRALEEMRALIATLRSSEALVGDPFVGVAPTLGDLPALVDHARSSGADVGATVFVSEASAAPPALTRAVYRIVQEALTNVVKHAPGARVEIDVRAAPVTGVDLTVRNRLPDLPARALARTGGGAGVPGMQARAATLGGTLEAGARDGWFEVRAHLPWPAPLS